MIVIDELSAFKVTDVRTPRPECSIHEEDIAADQWEETIMRVPPMLRERSLDTGDAEMGLLMMDVPGGSSSCIARRRKVDDVV